MPAIASTLSRKTTSKNMSKNMSKKTASINTPSKKEEEPVKGARYEWTDPATNISFVTQERFSGLVL